MVVNTRGNRFANNPAGDDINALSFQMGVNVQNWVSVNDRIPYLDSIDNQAVTSHMLNGNKMTVQVSDNLDVPIEYYVIGDTYPRFKLSTEGVISLG